MMRKGRESSFRRVWWSLLGLTRHTPFQKWMSESSFESGSYYERS